MKKYFLAGLALLLPLMITLFLAFFLLNFLTKPFSGLFSNLFSSYDLSPTTIGYLSQVTIIITFFLTTIVIGVFARFFFLKIFIRASDKLFRKIPIINKVYKTTKELINTIFITDKTAFKRVVLAPFPSSDTYCLGFISRTSPKSCSNALNSNLLTVFVPTTPNPTTGFLLICEEEKLIFLDEIKPEEAIKYIVSCGVIQPK